MNTRLSGSMAVSKTGSPRVFVVFTSRSAPSPFLQTTLSQSTEVFRRVRLPVRDCLFHRIAEAISGLPQPLWFNMGGLGQLSHAHGIDRCLHAKQLRDSGHGIRRRNQQATGNGKFGLPK